MFDNNPEPPWEYKVQILLRIVKLFPNGVWYHEGGNIRVRTSEFGDDTVMITWATAAQLTSVVVPGQRKPITQADVDSLLQKRLA